MTTYEITYRRTGRTGNKMYTDLDKVWINSTDRRADLQPVRDIIGAIEYFEELAVEWGTYETRHAITEIKVVE